MNTQPFMPNRVTIQDVARILEMMSQLANKRKTPREGDIQGDFDEWFDGGARRFVTGTTTYEFSDGTHVLVSVTQFLRMSIRFPNGETVQISQESREGN
jgi:hypothetical protein